MRNLTLDQLREFEDVLERIADDHPQTTMLEEALTAISARILLIELPDVRDEFISQAQKHKEEQQ